MTGETPGYYPAVVRRDEVYTVEEVARRLRWQKHSIRQARRMGLRFIKFGSRNYALGEDVIRFFNALAEKQAEGAR